MNKKIIILIVIIAIVAIIGGYFILNHQQGTEKTTLVLSDSAYMKVPVSSNATSKADKNGIFYYVDKEHGLNVTTYNSNVSKSSGLKIINKLKSDMESGSKKIDEGNVVIYEKDGVYSIFVKNTESNDTILLQSTNKKTLLECWESIKYHDPSDSLKFEDSSSVVNVTQETKTAIAQSDSGSSSGSSSSSDYSSRSDSSSDSSDSSSYPSAYSDSGGSSSSGSAYSDSGGSSGGSSSSGSAYSDSGGSSGGSSSSGSAYR